MCEHMHQVQGERSLQTLIINQNVPNFHHPFQNTEIGHLGLQKAYIDDHSWTIVSDETFGVQIPMLLMREEYKKETF